MNKEEIKFDHFKDIKDLLDTINMWYQTEEDYYSRWFGLTDLYMLGKYTNNLQSQLDKANEKLDKIKELVNKYGYYTLSEIPELLSIIEDSNE